MRLNIRSIVTTFLLAVLCAGNAHATPLPEVVTKLVAETKTKVTTIDMENFRKVVDTRAYDYIIDVREPDEYASGHVPGAINIPRGVIEFRIWPLVGYPDNTNTGLRIYTYCKTGSRCALAARSLQDLGFTDVTAVDMKLADWGDAGHPLVYPILDF